jgi:uncharacterized membrane protein YkvA (DUF1232 family)
MFKLGLMLAKFRKEILLMWYLVRDARAPLSAKWVAVFAALYVISPVDLITDFLPIIGWLDDSIVAYLLFKLAQRLLPADVLTALKTKRDENSRAHTI